MAARKTRFVAERKHATGNDANVGKFARLESERLRKSFSNLQFKVCWTISIKLYERELRSILILLIPPGAADDASCGVFRRESVKMLDRFSLISNWHQ